MNLMVQAKQRGSKPHRQPKSQGQVRLVGWSMTRAPKYDLGCQTESQDGSSGRCHEAAPTSQDPVRAIRHCDGGQGRARGKVFCLW